MNAAGSAAGRGIEYRRSARRRLLSAVETWSPRKKRSLPIAPRCASWTLTARILAITRGRATGAESLGTTITIPWQSPPPKSPASSGRGTLLAMLCLDEIRGRLAEVLAKGLQDRPCAAWGDCLGGRIWRDAGATAEQIESAIGMVVAHYVPFRAIRHGEQLSDSKGASAAISAEVAVLSMRRAMCGLCRAGRHFSQSAGCFLPVRAAAQREEPVDLELAAGGDDFAVMGMHFKLGLYEHQSAGRDCRADSVFIADIRSSLPIPPRLSESASRFMSRPLASSATRTSATPDAAKRGPFDGLYRRDAAAKGGGGGATRHSRRWTGDRGQGTGNRRRIYGRPN